MSSTGSSTSSPLAQGFSRLRPFDSDSDSDMDFEEPGYSFKRTRSPTPEFVKKPVYTAADIVYISDSDSDSDDENDNNDCVCTHSDVDPSHIDSPKSSSRESTPSPKSPEYSYAQPYDPLATFDSDSDDDDQSHVSLDLSTNEPVEQVEQVEPADDTILDLKRLHEKQLAIRDKKIKHLNTTVNQLKKIISLYELPKKKRRCVGKKSSRA